MLNSLRKRRADEGFTLIELLIVIVILGVLAAVVVISVGGITDRGRTSACSASRTSLVTATEAYYAQTGSYPASPTVLVPQYLNAGGATVSATGISSGGTGSNSWTVAWTAGTPPTIGACVYGS